ncbi:MAG TPA: polyketide cyclase [Gammaproteobacteria bacterium]|nr:polyketide cyclase [Gammaproteobacteria bacterium]|tara:strand:+ start:205 stop:675 length:471 start_codon:yes stop_codon:yes gene_type:complete
MSDFKTLIAKMTKAACNGDGKGAAACFTSTGTYHDCFYGAFKGKAIINMVENFFHRDAENFIWDVHDPVDNGKVGYARYVFSYNSKLPDAYGKRVVFEGVSVCRLSEGLIDDYREVADSVTGLYQLGFSDQRLTKLIKREVKTLRSRRESAHHIEH